MYLLTYKYGIHNRPNVALKTDGPQAYEACLTSSVFRNVELFERRGNDWIRIRPEETNAE